MTAMKRTNASEPMALVPVRIPPHPGSSSPQASARMSVARRRDTGPELELRRLLHAQGLRYRVAYPVPGQRRRTIDIAFTRAKVAVFLDGCFWHGCPDHGTQPKSNATWWSTKIAANQLRDSDTSSHLTGMGWSVVRLWEHVSATEGLDLVTDALFAARFGMVQARSCNPRGHA